MRITRFINSKDIRKYLESINYPFTSIEAAWLIWQCRDLTLKEKHAAWQELIDTMPDAPIEERPWVEARPSMHVFLKEYMQFQEELTAEIYKRSENEIYAGKIWFPRQEEVYPFSSVENCLAECRESFDFTRVQSLQVVKYRTDEPDVYVVAGEFRVEDGALMELHPGSGLGKAYERTIFGGAFFHFPLPFKKGDIVWNPHDLRNKEPFLYLSAGLDVYKETETKERILRGGDLTDMCARVYRYNKNLDKYVENDESSYMDLEYYKGDSEEARDCFLLALFDCLKAEANEQEFWIDLPETEREKILETFFPSQVMREHLLNAKLHKMQVLEMILGAPVPLTTKQAWLSKLSEKEPAVFRDALLLTQLEEKTDDELQGMIRCLYEKSFAAAMTDVEEALEETKLRDGELLYLKEYWYDDDLKGKNSSGAAPFLSLNKALEFVRFDLKECEYKLGDTIWYTLEKWAPVEDGEMEHRITYYLVGDEIVWFEKMKQDMRERHRWFPEAYDYSSGSRNLNLPVPFEVGDVVWVDCTPFRPIKEGGIIEAGEGVMLQALVQNEDGKWRTGAVRNTSLFSDYPLMSSLYRMVQVEAPERRGVFEEVAEALTGNPERGAALWKKINLERQSSEALTADEIRKMLGELKEDL